MKGHLFLLALCPMLFASPAGAQLTTGLDPDAATAAYLERLSPEEKARSDAYYEGGYWMSLADLLYGLGVAWFFLSSGLSRKLRDLAAGRSRAKALRTAICALCYIVLSTLLMFPLTVYDGFLREHRYGLSNQSFGPWMKDRAIALGVSVVILVPLLVLLYAVLRRAPRTWWLWGAVTTCAAMNVVFLAAPVYIMPLFNEYRALADPELREDILRMARANGVPADEVYQFDASRQSKRISANVSGLFGTMRVSLNDNLLERCSPAEVRAVMGHEIGHYALNHVYEGLVFFGVVLVAGFGFLKWTFDAANRRFGQRFGVRGIDDEAGLPLVVALLSVYFFAVSPLTNSYTRMNEAEADIFGLNASGEADGFAEVALKLGEYRKLDPGPVEEWLFFDHPSGRARIHMAMKWKAENAPSEPGTRERSERPIAWIEAIPYEESSGDLRRVYDLVKGASGNVDNVVKVHSLRPHTLEGHYALYRSVLHHPDAALPAATLETLGVYTSLLNRGDYSVAHHFEGLKKVLADEERAERIYAALSQDRPEDAFLGKELALLRYARKLTLDPREMVAGDVASMRSAGATDLEILEANQVASYFNYANRVLNGLGVTTEGDVLGTSPRTGPKSGGR